MVGVGAPGGAPSQGLTPRCKKIIELSLTEAARLGHHYVGTEHLLLGILREGDGVAVRVLSGTGVEPRRLPAAVVAAMGGEASPSPFRGGGKTREELVSLILQSAAARYDCCPAAAPFERENHPLDVDWNHIRQVVSHITISAENMVAVSFR